MAAGEALFYYAAEVEAQRRMSLLTTAPRVEREPAEPWWFLELDGGVKPRQDRALMALAARDECADALAIRKPRLRFFDPENKRAVGVQAHHRAVFRDEGDDGLILVPTDSSLREMGEIVAHEMAHAAQRRKYGPLRDWNPWEDKRREAQARMTHEDFGAFLFRNFGIIDVDVSNTYGSRPAIAWSRAVLFGERRGAYWTAPESLTA